MPVFISRVSSDSTDVGAGTLSPRGGHRAEGSWIPVIRFYRVRGLVQGVGFRAATQREALRLGLRGWVRNRQDGSVEVFVSGGAETIGRLEAWLARGPRGARVSSLEVASEDAAPPEADAGEGFVVRSTV